MRPGGKDWLVRLASIPAVAELYGPDLVDDDRLAVSVSQRAEESAGGGIERVDPPVGNIVSDEQGVAERAEISRRQREPPGEMKRAVDALENTPSGVEWFHEAC